MGEATADDRSAGDPGGVPDLTQVTVTLRTVDDRLRALVSRSMRQVSDGSAGRRGTEAACTGLGGELGAGAGVEALRLALQAEGVDDAAVSRIEELYLDAVMGAHHRLQPRLGRRPHGAG